MFRNYFISAVRSIAKSRSYAIINVTSLALGLAMSATAIAYVAYEYSWEDCHRNHDRIYRVETTYTHNDTIQSYARVMAPLADAVSEEVPGIEEVTAFRHVEEITVDVNRVEYRAGNLIFARPDFLNVFDVNVRSGDVRSVLTQPGQVLVSDSIARVLFPDQSPVGQLVTLKERWTGLRMEATVAGVFETMPRTTQVYCDFIAPYDAAGALPDMPTDRWNLPGTDLTYLLLGRDADPGRVEAAVEEVARRRIGSATEGSFSFRLKPLKDIYFDTYFSGNRGELHPGGEYEIIFLITAMALFILFQAVANFINLATARSADRAREVGVRKTFGARRGQLIRQFLGESMLLTLAALVLGLPVYELCRIGLATYVPTREISGIFSSPIALAGTLGLAVLTGLAAGLYPALYLSRPQPVTVLRGRGAMQASRPWLRRGLVVFQFALAIVFIVTTVIIYRQARFVSQFDLGFDGENVLVLEFEGDDAAKDCALMNEQVRSLPGVLGTVRTGSVIGTRDPVSWGFFPNPDRREEDMIVAKAMSVGPEFVDMFGLHVVQGRDFLTDRPDDLDRSILINESMVRELKIGQPLGYRFYRDEDKVFEVVGVVRDFQIGSIDWAYQSKSAVILNPGRCRVLNVRLAGSGIQETIAAIQACWERTLPSRDFVYSFLVDEIQASYHEMHQMIRMFGVLAIVSIGIACLGILGLVSYTAERKTKEIGIRKVLGASIPNILSLFSREFLVLIAIANLVAWPGAYFLTRGFLSEFAFRVNPGIGTYVLGGVLSAVMAMATAAYQSLRAARANPVDALRYE